MKMVYPVIFTKLPDGYMAYVPDMDINTQGDDLQRQSKWRAMLLV